MFSGYDSRSSSAPCPYLFREGMTFTVTLTLLAMTGGIIFGTLLAMMRLSSHKWFERARGSVRQPHAFRAAGARDLLVLLPGALHRRLGIGANEPVKVGRSSRASSRSRCSRPPTTARSCARRSSRSPVARSRRATLWDSTTGRRWRRSSCRRPSATCCRCCSRRPSSCSRTLRSCT